MRKCLQICLLIVLLLQLTRLCFVETFPVIKPVNAPAFNVVVQVYPSFINVDVGKNFTVAIIGLNLIDLYGFDIEFTWDPTVLSYVSHTTTVPRTSYPAPNPPSPYEGALNPPTIPVKDIVNENGNIPDARYPETRAWFAYASMGAPTGQSGNITFFTITFYVLKHGESPLKIIACDLANSQGNPISCTVINGIFRTSGTPVADFNYWPNIPVVNKPTNFTAVLVENYTNIKVYMWDLGDGTKKNTTQPTMSHVYTEKGVKNVGLKVIDENDVESSWIYKEVNVVTSRDLGISSISFPAAKIKVDPLVPFTFKVAINNNGEADEDCTIYTYYNTSLVDPMDPRLSSWQLIASQNITLYRGGAKLLDFNINTTTLSINASYCILVNITTCIPEGYEEDVNNNMMLSSETFFVTNIDIHEIKIVKIECIWQSGAIKANPPLIEGEDVTVLLSMKNSGTSADEVYVELFFNTTLIESKKVSISWGETKEISLFRQSLNAGRYNVSVKISAGDYTMSKCTFLRIIKPPRTDFTFMPTKVVEQKPVTFDASITLHQDPEGVITTYKWEFFAPGLDWTTANPTVNLEGMAVTYNFTKKGVWTIVLKVEDNFGIKYDSKRPATSAYLIHKLVNVGEATVELEEPSEGFPTEYLIITVILIVLIIVVFAVYVRKRKAKVTSDEERRQPNDSSILS